MREKLYATLLACSLVTMSLSACGKTSSENKTNTSVSIEEPKVGTSVSAKSEISFEEKQTETSSFTEVEVAIIPKSSFSEIVWSG